MALRLNIRWQLALVSVALSLVPIAVVGVLAYQIARGALEERIRLNLETLAVQSDEKLERLLLDHHQNLAVWSQLGFIRDDAVTGDADGRIQQFLQEAKRNTDVAQELWVANAAGTVIASTLPALRGREVGDREFLQAARRGETWVGIAHDAGPDRPRGHAPGVSAAGQLRSLQAGWCARRRARLAEDSVGTAGRTGAAGGTGRARLSRACELAGRAPRGTVVLVWLGAGPHAIERAGARFGRHDHERAGRAAASSRCAIRPTSPVMRRPKNGRICPMHGERFCSCAPTWRSRRSVTCCGPSSCCPSCWARLRPPDRSTGRRSSRGRSCRWCRSSNRWPAAICLRASPSRAATSSACSPTRRTTWPTSSGSCCRTYSRPRSKSPARQPRC